MSADREREPGRRALTGLVLGGLLDLLAFLCELALLVGLATAGWGLGDDGLLGIALAVLYPALAVLIWGAWLAPRAARRLPDPWRYLIQIGLFAAVATALAFDGHVVVGVVFAVVAAGVFAAGRSAGSLGDGA